MATDGHRLALINFPKEDAKATLPNVLIPKKALAEILKMDGGADTRVEIRHSENHLLFTVGNRQLIARLLDVNFPDYEKILSKNNDRSAMVATSACQAAIRRVSLFSSERSRGVKLTFEKDLLTVASASQELGEGTETLDASFEGEAALDRFERAVPPGFSGRGRDAEREAGSERREHPMPLSTGGRHRGSLSLHLRRHADAPVNFLVRPNALAAFANLDPGLPQPLLRPGPFGTGVTLITGENAQGKTNLLEAVALVCGQRSFRGATAAQWRRDGERFTVTAQIERAGRAERLRALLVPRGRPGVLPRREGGGLPRGLGSARRSSSRRSTASCCRLARRAAALRGPAGPRLAAGRRRRPGALRPRAQGAQCAAAAFARAGPRTCRAEGELEAWTEELCVAGRRGPAPPARGTRDLERRVRRPGPPRGRGVRRDRRCATRRAHGRRPTPTREELRRSCERLRSARAGAAATPSAGPHRDDLLWTRRGRPLASQASAGELHRTVALAKLAEWQHGRQASGERAALRGRRLRRRPLGGLRSRRSGLPCPSGRNVLLTTASRPRAGRAGRRCLDCGRGAARDSSRGGGLASGD